MKNQIGRNLSLVKKLYICMAGLSVLVVPLVLGIINAQPIQAHSLDNDPNKYSVDKNRPVTFEGSGDPGHGNGSFQIINEKPQQKNFIAISNIKTIPGSIKLNPVSESFPNDKAKEKLVLAQTETQGKTSSAAGNRGVAPKTGDAAFFISRGISYMKKGQFEDAVSNFNRAINLAPRNAVAHVARGSAYYNLNQLDKAMSDYNEAIELNPNLAVAYQNRGSVYFHQAKFDDALSDYTKAIELNPNLAAAYQDRGNIYQSQGRFDDAASAYSKVLELKPDDSAAYSSRGMAYFSLEQHQKAFVDFNRAIELNPDNVDAYIYRGYYYQVMDEKSKAVADYSKALELNPEAAVAGRLRDEIAEMSANDDPKYAEAKDDQTIECHWTLPMNSNIKKQECKTREEWDKIEKTIQFERDVIQGPNYSYFINRIQGS